VITVREQRTKVETISIIKTPSFTLCTIAQREVILSYNGYHLSIVDKKNNRFFVKLCKVQN